MSEELITNQNISIEKLKELFDSAFLETTIDKEGDLVLQGNYKCFVEVPESKRFVRFASYIIASENASDEAKATYANRINKELAELLKKDGFKSLEQAIGADNPPQNKETGDHHAEQAKSA